MRQKLIREWKKVFESDLAHVAYELKDIIDAPAMIILEGAMGAGKTTFVKSFIDDGETISPSYALLSETNSILHADLYRLKNYEELLQLELELYLPDKMYFLVEWGKDYYSELARELPNNYQSYLLSIDVNDQSQAENESKRTFGRNFSLYELDEN